MAARKKSSPQSDAAPVLKAERTKTENPLVFISHDSRDADLADAFANLLTDASGGILKSFRSSARKGTGGIEFGQESYRAIKGIVLQLAKRRYPPVGGFDYFARDLRQEWSKAEENPSLLMP
jgi:hypothetical protein